MAVPEDLEINNPRFPTMEVLTPSPSIAPTPAPTKYNTGAPSPAPSFHPTQAPTKWDETPAPTVLRTHMPTAAPTFAPTTRSPT